MSIRDHFVQTFSEELALQLEAAAEQHASNMTGDQGRGSDPFKWTLIAVIGGECFTNENYAKHHGIECDPEAVRQWIKDHADLGSHDGDADVLAAICGMYNEYMPPPLGTAAVAS